MKKLLSLIMLCVTFASVNAQYAEYALKFSQNFPSITARSMSMGGAFTSLGGDFSSAYVNPAGLGMFRSSELVISPLLTNTTNETTYNGGVNNDNKYQFTMGSIGYTGTINSRKDRGLLSTTFSIGYSRMNNLSKNNYISGTNFVSSLSDVFVEIADGYYPEELHPFYDQLAFNTWVIDTLPGDPTSYGSLVSNPVDVDQINNYKERGGTGQWSFALGMNFNNFFYWGLGIGLNNINYDVSSEFTEINYNPSDVLRSYTFYEDISTQGTGINLKTGFIFRIANFVRVGGTFESPTFYKFDELSYNYMYSDFGDSSFIAVPLDPDGYEYLNTEFSYKLNTPMKISGGASVQIGTVGIVAVDVEYINYNSMKLRADKNFEEDYGSGWYKEYLDLQNESINDTYKSVINLRLGGEVRINNFFIRAGGGYFPSPYKSEELNKDASYTEITGGTGFRNNRFFVDLGFSAMMHKEKYNLYATGLGNNISSFKQNIYRFMLSAGYRF